MKNSSKLKIVNLPAVAEDRQWRVCIYIDGSIFFLVLKNSIFRNRQIGIWTALGIDTGISLHLIYPVLGLAIFIPKSILLFNAIKILGAIYLIYLGWQAIRSRGEQGLTLAKLKILNKFSASKLSK